jgi:hypothetical protein
VTPGEPAAGPGAAVVLGELRALGRDDGIAAIGRLSDGSIADAWLITYADGAAVVGKTVTAALPGVFAVEAAGLAALRGTGYLASRCFRCPWYHRPRPGSGFLTASPPH